MKHRFYKFYDFTGYPPFKPLVQSQLKRRIEKLSSINPEWQEKDYIKYFCEIFLNDSESESEKLLAHWHLVAYLDRDRCFLIWRSFHHISLYAVKSEQFHTLTNEILFHPNKFRKYLNKYNSQHQSQASIKTYILGVLKNSIREKLDLQSGWHLLCNVDINSTRKINNFGNKIKQYLAEYGIKEPNISRYIFAWQYFVAIYKNNKIYQYNNKTTQRWPQPDNSDFAEAAQYYNLQKIQPHAPLQASSNLEVTAEIIKQWMNICIQALQQSKRITELYDDTANYEEKEELAGNNDLIGISEDDNVSELEQVEIILTKEIINIENNLALIRSKIPLAARKAIMPLCYSYRLAIYTQKQLANYLKINQGTISRYISKHIEIPLLNKFQEIIKKQFNLQFYLKIFLSKRFNNPNNNLLDRLLVEAIKSLEFEKQIIIRLQYGEKLELSEINLKLGTEKYIHPDNLIAIGNELQQVFEEKLTRWQSEYIKFWLRNYYENMIRDVLLEGFKQLRILHKEIIQKRYIQKMSESSIIDLYPQYPVIKIINEAIDQLKCVLLQWLNLNFGLILQINNCQVIETIESWLLRELIYLEI